MTNLIGSVVLGTSAVAFVLAATAMAKAIALSRGWLEDRARLEHAMRELDDDHVRMWRLVIELLARVESAGIAGPGGGDVRRDDPQSPL